MCLLSPQLWSGSTVVEAAPQLWSGTSTVLCGQSTRGLFCQRREGVICWENARVFAFPLRPVAGILSSSCILYSVRRVLCATAIRMQCICATVIRTQCMYLCYCTTYAVYRPPCCVSAVAEPAEWKHYARTTSLRGNRRVPVCVLARTLLCRLHE